ncbi:hypothetical protein H5410_022245 [Solanum commersonii]|uniref:Uncharacterized protein n=1 Tax=Solanum commersonii TaxID=4109 RepID=A0A9J5ZHH2_SOLCO|nr:hypothetical protein H5410_022245 [Solanum commersonii]
MDDLSPSMRIKRVMPLHVNVFDNPPSFSMGLTQDFGVNKVINNVKASGIKIVEGGSKRKAIKSNSEESGSASSEIDKSEEHHEHDLHEFYIQFYFGVYV